MVQFHSRYRGIKKVYQLTIQSLPASSQIHQRPIQLEGKKKQASLSQGMTVTINNNIKIPGLFSRLQIILG